MTTDSGSATESRIEGIEARLDEWDAIHEQEHEHLETRLDDLDGGG